MDSATITCPYCGSKNEISDLFEYDEGRHETDCEHCGKPFTFSLEIDVAYALTDAERIEEKEYVPTVEMTTYEYVYFRSFRFTGGSFVRFYQSVSNQLDQIKFGLKKTPVYFLGLSENELMQAWLQPEKIKVVEEK